ncbi:protein SERAC1 isoform X2 [Adelges cooleyi]|uniref:protein SERAC1 isoform X2 n=1 Tax=Adelges cooleyi TaxID=133065 RepID=UPI00218047AE|nr:protein SERAC1 isoform X2 [Adelges cooleyi]
MSTAMYRNFVKSTRDVMCVVCCYNPDLKPYDRLPIARWVKVKMTLYCGVVLLSRLWIWLGRYGWWLTTHLLRVCDFYWSTWGQGFEESDVDGPRCEVQCEVLYDPGPESTLMDVVFIHGLRGDKFKTWKQGVWKQVVQQPEPMVVRSAVSTPSEVCNRLERMATVEEIKEFTNCWPRDWLPLDCPYVRVITISYSTDPYLWRPIWLRKSIRSPMKDRGLEMMSLLGDCNVGQNPITWVGHSKGGLFIKQILVLANHNHLTQQIITSTKGILFYSVPHNGSPLANIKLPLFQRSIELQELVNDTQHIQGLQKEFYEIINNNGQIQVKSFIETKLTLMKLIYLRIVSVQSADPGLGDLYGVPLDHRNICKPKNRNCFLYQELVNMIHSFKRPE